MRQRTRTCYLVLGLILSTCVLAACQGGEQSYEYFMTHPDQLARAINRCKSLSGEALLDDPYCKVVMQARNDFAQLLMINQQNPQAFGAQLLVEQELLISEQQKRESIEKRLRKLKRSGKVSIAAANELQDKLSAANTIIDQQTQKVEQMLTAIRVLGV